MVLITSYKASKGISCSWKGFLSIYHSFNAVVHVLNKFFLGATESSFVGNVESGISRLRVLSVDTADLDVILVSNRLKRCHVLGKLGKLDVN